MALFIGQIFSSAFLKLSNALIDTGKKKSFFLHNICSFKVLECFDEEKNGRRSVLHFCGHYVLLVETLPFIKVFLLSFHESQNF